MLLILTFSSLKMTSANRWRSSKPVAPDPMPPLTAQWEESPPSVINEKTNITIASVFTELKHDIRECLHFLSRVCARIFSPFFAVCFCLGNNEGFCLPCAFYQGTVLFSRLIKIMDCLRWLITSKKFLLSSRRKAFWHVTWIRDVMVQ